MQCIIDFSWCMKPYMLCSKVGQRYTLVLVWLWRNAENALTIRGFNWIFSDRNVKLLKINHRHKCWKQIINHRSWKNINKPKGWNKDHQPWRLRKRSSTMEIGKKYHKPQKLEKSQQREGWKKVINYEGWKQDSSTMNVWNKDHQPWMFETRIINYGGWKQGSSIMKFGNKVINKVGL